jgi:hypothetical protein
LLSWWSTATEPSATRRTASAERSRSTRHHRSVPLARNASTKLR